MNTSIGRSVLRAALALCIGTACADGGATPRDARDGGRPSRDAAADARSAVDGSTDPGEDASPLEDASDPSAEDASRPAEDADEPAETDAGPTEEEDAGPAEEDAGPAEEEDSGPMSMSDDASVAVPMDAGRTDAGPPRPAGSSCGAPLALAPTYHVSPSGNDAGDGSAANPWRTIGFAITRMAGGDVLFVHDGLYEGSANVIRNVPAGTRARPTVIAATTPMAVRIRGTSGPMLELINDHVRIDGFIFDLTVNGHDSIAALSGRYGHISRCIFRRAGDARDYGSLIWIDGNDNLVEDVAGVGAGRYLFGQGGPESSTQRNIWRRVVGRMDYSSSTLPKATFVTYGNNGDTSVRDHRYQNIIAIDGQAPSLGSEGKYGGFYFAKNASNIVVEGSIVLNEAVLHAGLFAREWGTGNVVRHTVVWDITDGAVGVRSNRGDRLTIGGFSTSSWYDAELSDSLVGSTPPALLNATPGAVVLTRYGRDGTFWGDPGYDEATSVPLWPWTCEREIQMVFAERIDPPPGSSPPANNTLRGFAGGGTGLYGGPVTLTSYIWEYLGTPCPASVCTP